MDPLLLLLCALMIVAIVLIITFRPKPNNNIFALNYKLDELFTRLDRISDSLQSDFRTNREEMNSLSRENRRELSEALGQFKTEVNGTLQLITVQNRQGSESINRTLEERITALLQRIDNNNLTARETLAAALKDFSAEQRLQLNGLNATSKETAAATTLQLESIRNKVEERLQQLSESAKTDGLHTRSTLENSFGSFNTIFKESIREMNSLQREKFAALEARQQQLVESTEKKLEQMRETVDEKLQKTLNERLGQSFEMVGRQLENVQKGLGEMQSLAQDVGGLKRVLSNVKMRGGFGEVQLSMLLENILAPDQYEANVKLKEGSTEVVEFAIKMPNREDERNFVWLAIDAKFPRDAYEYLQNAYDSGIPAQIEEAQKNLENTIRKMARDICEKYINPPHTTDFAILFLPFEGIYAEVVRKASLLEEIQRQCKVVVTGPTTLAAILNSLQLGFRTLAIQKRSSEVWKVLGEVKKEFDTFGGLLEKAQKNLQTATNQIDEVMGKRTRAIQRKLKGIETADGKETMQLEEIE